MTSLGRRPLDFSSAQAFLDEVRTEFAWDMGRYRQLLECFRDWILMDSSSCTSADLRSRVIEIAGMLMHKPKLVHGFNALLDEGQLLVCCTNFEEVEYVVFKTPEDAWILSTTDSDVPAPASITELRGMLSFLYGDKELLELNASDQYLCCLAQLLQFELDHAANSSNRYKEVVTRCLYSFAKKCFVPPSLFLDNVALEDQDAVFGGGFADIYHGRISGVRLCVKALRMFQQDSDYKRKKLHSKFSREVLLWRQLKHPNVLPFFGASSNIIGRRFCLISPWMSNGNIMQYLERHPNHNRLQSIFEIIDGITYLHSLSPPVVHKDIKGANVLVTDSGACCIADFGLSSIVASQSQNGTSSAGIEGSVYWLAPEAMHFIPGSNPMESTKIDIFAFACTTYEIYTGKPPFSERMIPFSVMLAVYRGERPPLPPTTVFESQTDTDRLWKLVELCWKGDPEERPKAREVKQSIYEMLKSSGSYNQVPRLWSTQATLSGFEERAPGTRQEAERWLDSELNFLVTGLRNRFTPPVTPVVRLRRFSTIDSGQAGFGEVTPTATMQLPTPSRTPIPDMKSPPLRASASLDSARETRMNRRLNPYAQSFTPSPEIQTKLFRSSSASAADFNYFPDSNFTISWKQSRQNSLMVLDSSYPSLTFSRETTVISENRMILDNECQEHGSGKYSPDSSQAFWGNGMSVESLYFSPPATPPPLNNARSRRSSSSTTRSLRPDASPFVPTFLRAPHGQ